MRFVHYCHHQNACVLSRFLIYMNGNMDSYFFQHEGLASGLKFPDFHK